MRAILQTFDGCFKKSFGAFVVALLLLGCQAPSIQTGADAEISFDGLHRVDNARADDVWMLPGVDFSKYNKVRLDETQISYRPVQEPSQTMRSVGTNSEFPLDQNQKLKLEIAAKEAFLEALAKSKHYTLVTEEGTGVLEVSASLIDVVSRVPPENADRGDVFLTEIGVATLVLELRDSATEQLLVRSTDRRRVENNTMVRSTSVRNMSEVRMALRQQAKLLTENLDKLHLSQGM
jgi:hypothetical protein